MLNQDLPRLRRFLERVKTGALTDDANLHGSQLELARRAYREGLIHAWPIEGSDAPVEALAITESGRNWLALPRPKEEA